MRRLSSISFLECIIALALIAGAATVVIPRWTKEKITTNESAAVTHLSSIVDAQRRFHERCGAFALLQELTGDRTSRELDTLPALLDLPRPSHGVSEVDGYLFTVYLPSAEGHGALSARDVNPTLARRSWIAYAWPLHYGITGRRVFVVNSDGQVFAEENAGTPLAGLKRVPFASLAWTTLRADTPFQEPVSWVKQVRWEPVAH